MLMKFKKWMEDAGEVFFRTNDGPYAERGIRSQMANDAVKIRSQLNLRKLFGRKKKKNDIFP
jgi:hypothetical protein